MAKKNVVYYLLNKGWFINYVNSYRDMFNDEYVLRNHPSFW